MADRYSTDGVATVTASPGNTAVSLNGVTTTRAKVYDFTIGSDGTPADVALNYAAQRFTASGTGTAVTPRPLDLDAPAALLTAEEDHSAEPTYTADLILWNIAANQRATYRWVAAPDGELMIPATADAGIGWFVIHASATPTIALNIHHYE